MTRNEAIMRIKSALRKRSGRAWSVRGGCGTAWGWIHITTKPSRRKKETWHLSATDRMELAQLFGYEQTSPSQGLHIPASDDYYREFVERAEGKTPTKIATPYWD